MTKEELREKRNLVIGNLHHAIAILGSDELYIDELEKENLYYKDIIETNTAEWEEQEQRVVALEKENAELKEKYVQNICDCDICDTYCNSQLTKAKDILKRLVSLSNNSRSLLGGTWHETVREAEQFLNSEVEK